MSSLSGERGIRTDSDKISAVYNIPTPKTIKEVRQFLVFANFYSRFLSPKFPSIIVPITHLTSAKNPFVWNNATRDTINLR